MNTAAVVLSRYPFVRGQVLCSHPITFTPVLLGKFIPATMGFIPVVTLEEKLLEVGKTWVIVSKGWWKWSGKLALVGKRGGVSPQNRNLDL